MLFLDAGIYGAVYFSRHPSQPPLLPRQVQQDRQRGWEAEKPHGAPLVSTVVPSQELLGKYPDTRGSIESTLFNLMFRYFPLVLLERFSFISKLVQFSNPEGIIPDSTGKLPGA